MRAADANSRKNAAIKFNICTIKIPKKEKGLFSILILIKIFLLFQQTKQM